MGDRPTMLNKQTLLLLVGDGALAAGDGALAAGDGALVANDHLQATDV